MKAAIVEHHESLLSHGCSSPELDDKFRVKCEDARKQYTAAMSQEFYWMQQIKNLATDRSTTTNLTTDYSTTTTELGQKKKDQRSEIKDTREVQRPQAEPNSEAKPPGESITKPEPAFQAESTTKSNVQPKPDVNAPVHKKKLCVVLNKKNADM